MKKEELEQTAATKSSKVFKNIFFDKESIMYEFHPYNGGDYIQILANGNPIFKEKRILIWNPKENKMNIDSSYLVIDYESIDEGFIFLWSGSEYKKLVLKK